MFQADGSEREPDNRGQRHQGSGAEGGESHRAAGVDERLHGRRSQVQGVQTVGAGHGVPGRAHPEGTSPGRGYEIFRIGREGKSQYLIILFLSATLVGPFSASVTLQMIVIIVFAFRCSERGKPYFSTRPTRSWHRRTRTLRRR